LKRCFARWYLRKLSEITTELVEDWKVDRFREGCTPSTVLRDIATLSAVLSRAVKMGKLDDNPVRRVDKPKIDRRPQVRYLDTDEETRLRRALIHRDQKAQKMRKSANLWRRKRRKEELPTLSYFADHLTPAVLISMNTGLRRGELLALTWADVNTHERILTVRSKSAKTGDTRHVPLNDEALETLKRWRKQNLHHERVFPIATSFKTAWAALLDEAQIATRFRWHDLRHNSGTRIIPATDGHCTYFTADRVIWEASLAA
jgi:integrase